jgi:hypothetical protein
MIWKPTGHKTVQPYTGGALRTGGLMNSGKAQTTSMPYSGRKVDRGHLRRS